MSAPVRLTAAQRRVLENAIARRPLHLGLEYARSHNVICRCIERGFLAANVDTTQSQRFILTDAGRAALKDGAR